MVCLGLARLWGSGDRRYCRGRWKGPILGDKSAVVARVRGADLPSLFLGVYPRVPRGLRRAAPWAIFAAPLRGSGRGFAALVVSWVPRFADIIASLRDAAVFWGAVSPSGVRRPPRRTVDSTRGYFPAVPTGRIPAHGADPSPSVPSGSGAMNGAQFTGVSGVTCRGRRIWVKLLHRLNCARTLCGHSCLWELVELAVSHPNRKKRG